jgi:rare lipoprotein A
VETALKAALTAGTLAAFGGEANAELSVSSWYGPGFERSTTASGEVYRTDARTAAHLSLPFGTKVLVTYGER